ncbi:MAG: alkaline phosphatase PhoX [Vicinamibacterales bacterium]
MFEKLSRNQRKDLSEALDVAHKRAQSPWSPSGWSNPMANVCNRRAFLRGGAGLVGGAVLAKTLGNLSTISVEAAQCSASGPTVSPWGPVAPAFDPETGLNLLKLPPGFSYRSYGWTGDPMDDNAVTATPPLHDGMAVIQELDPNHLILVRNHEVNHPGPSAFGDPSLAYDPSCGGGTTNLIFDTSTGQFISAVPSISGNIRNCSGGVTPWGTWYTCEETGTGTTTAAGHRHGYVFEVGPLGPLPGGNPIPFPDMGNFSHEAMATDPATGITYLTEDGPSAGGDGGSGFYRFIYNTPGKAEDGGTLQMLAVKGRPGINFQTTGCENRAFPVRWVTVENPDPDVDAGEESTFQQGLAGGGANFRRLEGCWYGARSIFFVSTNGGPDISVPAGTGIGEGQLFEYDPKSETLRIRYVSPSRAALENPDNIVVAPDGSIVFCEDNSEGSGGTNPNEGERLVWLYPKTGRIFTFALNNMDFTSLGTLNRPSGMSFSGNQKQNEWAGAVFSPDGRWLFANVQTPGVTFAITGPWPWL